MTPLRSRALACALFGAALAAGAAVAGERAADQPPRTFGVVDLSDPPAAPAVRQRVAREVTARGLTAVADPTIQRALEVTQPPAGAASQLLREARDAREAGDCAAALPRALAAEDAALTAIGIDEARPLARTALAVTLFCADALGRTEAARRAALQLRHLGAAAPDGVPAGVWQRYAAPPGAPAAPVELTVDSEPPNARVAVNFRQVGTTPLTLEVPPGEATVQIEKDGFTKSFRRVTAQRAPVAVTVALTERRRDRAGEIARRVLALRGADPGATRPVLAQLAQLARVDVLVAFVARGGSVRVWWFDAERGDLLGPPAVLPPLP